MKRKLSHANIVNFNLNFKLIGAMAGAASVILYPFVAGAESTDKSESEQNKHNKSR